MNPFVYGKSLPNKSSPKIIGTLTPLHPWLIVMLKFAGANRVKKTFQSSGKEFPIKPHSLAHFAIKMTKGH